MIGVDPARHTLATLTAMGAGAWFRVVWTATAFRQAMAIGDNEEPIAPDPFGLLGIAQTTEAIVPYNPEIWAALKTHGVG